MSENQSTKIAKAPGSFSKILMVVTPLITVPGILMRLGVFHNGPGAEALIFGCGLLGAAFMLSWAAEVIQMDISQGFALALLALIAVLPEYAVDMVFAWDAGKDITLSELALANMTGANRLLIGIGWPMVLLIFFLRSKKKTLELHKGHSTEVFYMACATVYAFTIPFKNELNLVDAAVLISIFTVYIIRTAKAEVEEPDLVGPAAIIGKLHNKQRRMATGGLFLFAGFIIFISAEPFAHSLKDFAIEAGMDEFLVVQWLAPLASEAPEFMVAAIWAFRLQAQAAIGALISSKVNQWTLLVGTLPIVYSISAGKLGALPLDLRQDHEIWLTAGQSIFAIAILTNLRMSWYGAILLAVLFLAQLIFSEIRMEVFYIYLAFATLILIRDRKRIPSLFKIGMKFK